jgi:hypothetical protein
MVVTASQMAYLFFAKLLLGQGYDTVLSGRCENFFYKRFAYVIAPTILCAPGALAAIAGRQERDANRSPALGAHVKNE